MGCYSFSCVSASVVPFLLFGAIALEGCSGGEPASSGDAPPGTSASSGGSSSSSSGGSSTSSSSSSSSSSASSGGGAVDAGQETGVDAGKSTMTFFVTSTGNGAKGGNFGGLAGADKKCQDHAAAVGGGDHTWVAYLSTQAPKLAAKDRIGPGPWKNHAGVVIASSNAVLHANGFNIDDADILDEKGSKVPASESAILTGTAASGDVFQNANCNDWTTNAAAGWCGRANSVADTTKDTDTWNSSFNCFCGASSAGSKSTQRIYCFAKD